MRHGRTHTRFIRSMLLAVGAFCLYGGWAFVANQDHGMSAGLQALLTQGTVSFFRHL